MLKGAYHLVNLFGASSEEIGTEYKVQDGDTPKTLIDLYAQKEILRYLANHPRQFKDFEINAEEELREPIKGLVFEKEKNVYHFHNKKTQSSKMIDIDPFDGTSNAAISFETSVTGMSLEKNNDVYASIIANPWLNELQMLCAETGKGAWKYRLNLDNHGNVTLGREKPSRLELKHKEKKPNQRYVFVDSLGKLKNRERKARWIENIWERYAENIRSQGSNIHSWYMVAQGNADSALIDCVGGWFDISTGLRIIKEAGGEMVNIYGKTPRRGDQVAIAVANPKDLEQVLEITHFHYSGYKGFK